MLIAPLGLENTPVVRRPWLTFALASLVVTAFAALGWSHASRERAVITAAGRAAAFWEAHPYLEPPDEVLDLLEPGVADAAAAESLRRRRAGTLPPPARLEEEQQEFQGRVQALRAAADSVPWRPFAFHPEHGLMQPGLFTHFFVHLDATSLLAVLLLLSVAGPSIEARYGVAAFLLLGLGAVSSAGVLLLERGETGTGPLVGGSAVASAWLGALLAQRRGGRLRIWYWALVSSGTTTVRRGLLLSVWLVAVVWTSRQGDLHVAFSHAAGLASGVLFAAIATVSGLERLFSTFREVDLVPFEHPELPTATSALARGDLDGAKEALTRVITRDPDNAFAMEGLVRIGLQQGDSVAISRLIDELAARQPKLTSDPNLLMLLIQCGELVTPDRMRRESARRVAQALEEAELSLATRFHRQLKVGPDGPASALWLAHQEKRHHRLSEALAEAAFARTHPQATEEQRSAALALEAEIEASLARERALLA